MLWYLIQLILFIIFILGIYNLAKRKIKFGVIQVVSSVMIFAYNFLFIMHRDWVNGTQSPQDYFIEQLIKLDINSIIILLSFLTLVFFSIRFFDDKRHS